VIGYFKKHGPRVFVVIRRVKVPEPGVARKQAIEKMKGLPQVQIPQEQTMRVNRPGVVDGVILCTHITHPKDSTEAECPEIFERYGCEGLEKTERKVKVYVAIVDGGVTLAQAVCLRLGNA
jgi:hypothetical protein